jgi:hypothetical protein
MSSVSDPAQATPLRLIDSGRLDPSPEVWAKPLPPSLWDRIDEERRRQHERLVERYEKARR